MFTIIQFWPEPNKFGGLQKKETTTTGVLEMEWKLWYVPTSL